MDGNKFTAKEIQAILKSCRECGVTRLQIGTFEASFLPKETQFPVAATPTQEQLETQRKFESEIFLENEKRIREQQLSELRLSDPEAYEDLVNRGELENVGQESEGTNS